MESTCMVYMTAASEKEAEQLSTALLDRKLIACANIIPRVTSVYRWQDEVHHDSEAVIIAKTRSSLKKAVLEAVKELHSYECPCAVTYDMSDGLPDYLQWILAETTA